MSRSVPLVDVTCCLRTGSGLPFHAVDERYVAAAAEVAGVVPVLVPALGGRLDAASLVGRLDGLLVTGSPSNVEPDRYRGEPSLPGTLHDPARDATTLPLLRAALARDLPVLAICRGLQELNVALGGTLHQRVHEVPGRLDHRAPEGPTEVRYAYAAHQVRLAPGGFLEGLAGTPDLTVNSLHSQGIDRLGEGLAVEATAPDGQIEAVRIPGARFVVAVQWHPEFRAAANPFSAALLDAFGTACRRGSMKQTDG